MATWSHSALLCEGCYQNRCFPGKLSRWQNSPRRAGTWLLKCQGGLTLPSSWIQDSWKIWSDKRDQMWVNWKLYHIGDTHNKTIWIKYLGVLRQHHHTSCILVWYNSLIFPKYFKGYLHKSVKKMAMVSVVSEMPGGRAHLLILAPRRISLHKNIARIANAVQCHN